MLKWYCNWCRLGARVHNFRLPSIFHLDSLNAQSLDLYYFQLLSDLYLFADDLKVWRVFREPKDFARIQDEYCAEDRMYLNASKFQTINYSSRKLLQHTLNHRVADSAKERLWVFCWIVNYCHLQDLEILWCLYTFEYY